MPDQFGDKTHDPTPHRRQQAREKGQVAFSADLSSALVLVGGTLALLYLGGRLLTSVGQLMKLHLAGEAPLPADPATATSHLHFVLQNVARTSLPLLLTVMLIGVL